MAEREQRALNRLKRSYDNLFSKVSGLNEQTSSKLIDYNLKHLDDLYLEYRGMEKEFSVNDNNEKIFMEISSRHIAIRNQLSDLRCSIDTEPNNFNETSMNEIIANQTAILKEMSHSSRDSDPRLPHQNLPYFTGDSYAEYRSFRNLFDSIVHQNENISKVRKLQILKAHCKIKPII